jgi:mannose-6-phosphate isomerase-like protein (cupin superfamily)
MGGPGTTGRAAHRARAEALVEGTARHELTEDEELTLSDAQGDPAKQQPFPYVTRLDILHPALEVVDVNAIVASNTHRWFNQTLCKVNESVVRLGIVQGEYHWHQHNDLDEFFYVVEGRLLIDLEGRTVELGPEQGIVIPKGVQHRPRAPERVVVLMVEGEGIVPTGD